MPQAPDIGLKPRMGGVDVKGKGHMRTFWVSAGGAGGTGGAAGSPAAASFCCERALDALLPAGAEADRYGLIFALGFGSMIAVATSFTVTSIIGINITLDLLHHIVILPRDHV